MTTTAAARAAAGSGGLGSWRWRAGCWWSCAGIGAEREVPLEPYCERDSWTSTTARFDAIDGLPLLNRPAGDSTHECPHSHPSNETQRATHRPECQFTART